MNAQITKFLDDRRGRLEAALGKPLQRPSMPETQPLTDDERRYLRGEAEDLYWNELEWEKITDEERLDDGVLAQLAFPGFLAFVRGLMLRKALPDAGVPASPRPEVVEDLLGFLAGRVIELDEELVQGDSEDPDRTAAERAMTSQLVDLVMLHLHEVDPGDL
jgi:hypothetical protein